MYMHQGPTLFSQQMLINYLNYSHISLLSGLTEKIIFVYMLRNQRIIYLYNNMPHKLIKIQQLINYSLCNTSLVTHQSIFKTPSQVAAFSARARLKNYIIFNEYASRQHGIYIYINSLMIVRSQIINNSRRKFKRN